MGWPVVVVAKGGIPVSEVSNGRGTPLSIATNGYGTAVTVVDSGGLPVLGSGVVLVNENPVAVADSGYSTVKNTVLTIPASSLLANDYDPNGDPLTVTGVSSPVNGTVSFAANVVTFTPTTDYTGPASFTYTISDGRGGTASATVSLTVTTAANQPPVAVADSGYSTAKNTALTIPAASLLANDTDPDGNPLTVTGVSSPVNGTVSFAANVVTFTPTTDYLGAASFTYSISDGQGGTASASVSLTVTDAVTAERMIFTQTPALTGSDANSRLNFRVACTLAEDMGSEFRFTLSPGLPAENLTVWNAGAGIHAVGDPVANSTVPFIEVMYGGTSGFFDKTTPQTCDWTPAGALSGLVAGDEVLITFQTGYGGSAATTFLDGSTNSKSWNQADFDGLYWNWQNITAQGYNYSDDMIWGMVSIETRGAHTGGGVDPEPPGDAVVAFNQTPALAGSNANPGMVFRNPCTLAVPMLDEFRITIMPGSNLTVLHAGAGIYAGSGLPHSTIPIIETLFGGVAGFANKATPQTSDWTPAGALAGAAAGTKVLVCYQAGVAGQGAMAYLIGTSTNSTCFYQNDATDGTGTYWNAQNVDGMGFSPSTNSNFGVVKIETRTSGAPGGDPNYIPVGFDDPMFTGMTERTDTVNIPNGQSIHHQSFIEESGASTITCNDNNTVSYCRVKSREGVRISGSCAMHHCYFESEGWPDVEDHADTIQHYSPGQTGAVVSLKNSHIKAHLVDATANYFVADHWSGSVELENVIVEGGPTGVIIAVEYSTGHVDVSLKNVYFVGPFGSGNPISLGNVLVTTQPELGRGTVVVTHWENVRHATIVDGVLVPGAVIPEVTPENVDYTPSL